MSGRTGLVGAGGTTLTSTGNSCDPNNQPMDLVKASARSLESGSIVKSGNTTLVHYTTGGVAQILTSGASAHVVTAKPVGRTESLGVGQQTVTLVSRTSGPTTALNLATPGTGSGGGGGSGSGPSVRTVAHPSPAVTTSAPTQMAPYHIPRGPAAVANMAAPRSQAVATPIVRTTGQPIPQPNSMISGPRNSMVGQRVVPVSSSGASGGWGRPSGPSPSHTGKLAPGIHSTVPATSLSLGVGRGPLTGPRAGQPGGSITTYHAGGRAGGMSGGHIRGAGTTTMRGMTTDGPRGSAPKTVHITQPIVQPQKYGTGVMSGGGRGGGNIGPGQGGTGSTIYTPSLGSQGTMRPQASAIAVRITTAPIPTSATPAVVSSQAGSSMGGMGMTSPSGSSGGGTAILTQHPTMPRPHHDHHLPLKTPIVESHCYVDEPKRFFPLTVATAYQKESKLPSRIEAAHINFMAKVRTPIAAHQTTKATGVQSQTLAFSDGPKVITQPAQGPPLALAQISGVCGVTSQKTQLSTISQQSGPQQPQQQHQPPVQHRGGGVMGGGVGRVMGGTLAAAPIPVAKVLPQQAGSATQGGPVSTVPPRPPSHGQVRAQSPAQATDPPPPHTSVFLHRAHTGVTVTSGVTGVSGERVVTTVPQYSIASQYYYDQGPTTYPVAGTTLVPHTLSSTHYVPASIQQASGMGAGAGGSLRVTPGHTNTNAGTGPIVGVNGPSGGHGDANQITQGTVTVPAMKPNASPRPSILRKSRADNDSTPLKATKNLSAALSLPMPSPPSPKRPDSRGNGNASSGSTTISANSSPDSSLSGLQIEEMDGSGVRGGSGGGTHTPPSMKQEPPDDATVVLPRTPTLSMAAQTSTESPSAPASLSAAATLTVPQPHLAVSSLHTQPHLMADGISPRKKPRKQQLMGNELQEARSSEDDLEHPPVKKNKRELIEDHNDIEGSEEEGGGGWSEPGGGGGGSSGGSCGGGGGSGGSGSHKNTNATTTVVLTNKPTMSLLGSFRQTWKPRHNHFVRHTDVKPKDEKRMTVNEIANQKMALQRVNGWKIVHLSGQVDDLVELEAEVVDRLHLLLGSLEKRTHPRKPYKDFEKDVNRLSELVKANIQRSKIIKDQMVEARSQMHKLFDHKGKIVDIMNKYSSKRSVRKKEKS